VVEIGDRHLDDLLTLADPLVVTDLPTLLWSPHGHYELVRKLLGLAQAVLLDSGDEPDRRAAIERSRSLFEQAYVVDLAWLRSTPWRERIATAFDPPEMRQELSRIAGLTIRHHPDSTVAALLLVGWLASRLHWRVNPLTAHGHALGGIAATRRQDVELRIESTPELLVRGLAGLELQTASGMRLGLDRGPGGLHAYRDDPRGSRREWTILGASRGELGILGEGIRQSLLRDPTYAPALDMAGKLIPR
jgi:glucose-6-phosphate dehydrogenase assembly protein OpcA